MKWLPAPEDLVRVFDKSIQSVPGAEKRKMFGYPAAFANGNMFAGLHQDSYVLRLSPADRSAFLKLPGAKLFEPMPGRTMAEYVVVPKAMTTSQTELAGWLAKAFGYAKTLPMKTKKAGTKKRK